MALERCFNCGHFVSQRAGKCPKCGAPVVGQNISPNGDNTVLGNNPPLAGSQQVARQPYAPSQPVQPTSQKPGKNNKLIIGLLSLIALLLVVLVIILATRDSKPDKSQELVSGSSSQNTALQNENGQEGSSIGRNAEADAAAVEAERQRVEAEKARLEQEQARIKAQERQENERKKLAQYDGSYYFNGAVRNNRGSREEYPFSISFTISNGSVSGTFDSNNNSGSLRGSISANGKMKLTEYNYNGSATGYYFSGTFNGSSYKGSYLCTTRRLSMSFWTY